MVNNGHLFFQEVIFRGLFYEGLKLYEDFLQVIFIIILFSVSQSSYFWGAVFIFILVQVFLIFRSFLLFQVFFIFEAILNFEVVFIFEFIIISRLSSFFFLGGLDINIVRLATEQKDFQLRSSSSTFYNLTHSLTHSLTD